MGNGLMFDWKWATPSHHWQNYSFWSKISYKTLPEKYNWIHQIIPTNSFASICDVHFSISTPSRLKDNAMNIDFSWFVQSFHEHNLTKFSRLLLITRCHGNTVNMNEEVSNNFNTWINTRETKKSKILLQTKKLL